MFSTSMVVAAFAGLVAPGSTTLPNWEKDYRQAQVQSARVQKPIAVFIGAGEGYGKAVAEGLTTDAAKRLKDSYVCVFVDTATASGKDLAASFRLTEGLVISDRSGTLQALRHEGKVATADLAKYVERFATVTTVSTTETNANGTVAAPVTVYPNYGYVIGGGCANGRCGR